jgi:hypothetical protein
VKAVMINELYHYLSEDALVKKCEFWKTNNKFLLYPPCFESDITQGIIKNFIYCLKNPIGGVYFLCKSNKPRLIKIILDDNARIFKFVGNPKEINWKKIEKNYDIVDMIVDDKPKWPIKFQQTLLINCNIVKNWIFDERLLMAEYLDNLEKLKRNEISHEDYFYMDFRNNEQVSSAIVVAKLLKYLEIGDDECRKNMKIVKNALKRVGVMK